MEKSSFLSALLVFARNAAPERAATEDKSDVTTNERWCKQKLVKLHPSEFRLNQDAGEPETGGRLRFELEPLSGRLSPLAKS